MQTTIIKYIIESFERMGNFCADLHQAEALERQNKVIEKQKKEINSLKVQNQSLKSNHYIKTNQLAQTNSALFNLKQDNPERKQDSNNSSYKIKQQQILILQSEKKTLQCELKSIAEQLDRNVVKYQEHIRTLEQRQIDLKQSHKQYEDQNKIRIKKNSEEIGKLSKQRNEYEKTIQLKESQNQLMREKKNDEDLKKNVQIQKIKLQTENWKKEAREYCLQMENEKKLRQQAESKIKILERQRIAIDQKKDKQLTQKINLSDKIQNSEWQRESDKKPLSQDPQELLRQLIISRQKTHKLKKQLARSNLDRTRDLSAIFKGQILFQNQQQCKYLVETIEAHTKNRIYTTKMIYSHQINDLNKVNLHKYIDKVSHLMVIVRTVCGQLIAGYSETGFIPKATSTGDGLLISITNRKVFPLLAGKRATNYDDYYIIFGNAELRIRQGEDKVFSNFGMNNGNYKFNQEPVNTLLGEGTEREVAMSRFEVHKMIFH